MSDKKEFIRLLDLYSQEKLDTSIESFKGITDSLYVISNNLRKQFSNYEEEIYNILGDLSNMSFGEEEISDLYINSNSLSNAYNQFVPQDYINNSFDYFLEDYISYIELLMAEKKIPSIKENWQEKYREELRIIKEKISKEIDSSVEDYEADTYKRLEEINKLISDHNSEYKDFEYESESLEELKSQLESLDSEGFDSEEDYEEYEEDLENQIEELNENLNKYSCQMDYFKSEILSIKREIEDTLTNSEIFSKIEDYLLEFEEVILEEIKDNIFPENSEYLKTCSYIYDAKNKEDSALAFIQKKELENGAKFDISLKTQSEYKNILVFNDNSIGFFNQEDEYQPLTEINYKYKDFVDDIRIELLKEKFRKKPKYIKTFNKINAKTDTFEDVYQAAEEFLKFENLFKAKNIDVEKEFEKKNAEKVIDYINKIEHEHNVEKFAKSIMSKKYMHLINSESLKYFEKIYELKISKTHLQENIGSKLAAFKTQEDLVDNLKIYINNINNFTKENILIKQERHNTEIICEEGNRLILKINDYEASKNLGSNSWCIVRYENYFRNYCSTNHQYIIYDFNKESIDREAMIGITIRPNGTHRAAHYKNDISISNYESYLTEIIKKDINRYKGKLDSTIEKIIFPENETVQRKKPKIK